MPVLPIDAGRYGSIEIRQIFQENNRLNYQLLFEASVAEAQSIIKMIPENAAAEIIKTAKSGRITLKRVSELEAVSDHDTAAVVEALSEKCSPNAKPWIHYGLTSNDVIDTTTSMQIRDALNIIEPKILKLALVLVNYSIKYRTMPAVGRTHGQHASIIAFGLKFAVWALELVTHIERIEEGKKRFLLCKTLGVVGTGSLMGEGALEVQKIVAKNLNLYPIAAATQVIARERFAEVQYLMALIGCTLDKMATEVRNLMRTEIGEVAEPFRKGQMGSSAVPIKRNPIKSERVSSLSRIVVSLVNVSLENIPLWHERDLSNSANERFTIPVSAILLDEMLNSMMIVMEGLKIDRGRVTSNLNLTSGQIHSEFILDKLVRKGVSRIEAYRDIQRVAFSALESGEHLHDAIKNDQKFAKLTSAELKFIFEPSNHLGASNQIIANVAKKVRMVKEGYLKRKV
jgi:adenylosuccinate lyase